MAAVGFGLVGGSGVAVNELVLYLLVNRVGVHYLAAAAFATAASTTSNFLLTEFGVFASRRQKGVGRRYLSFGALSLASMPARLPVLFLLTSVLAVHYLVSNLVALGTVFLARFLISDRFIWSNRVAEPAPDAVTT